MRRREEEVAEGQREALRDASRSLGDQEVEGWSGRPQAHPARTGGRERTTSSLVWRGAFDGGEQSRGAARGGGEMYADPVWKVGRWEWETMLPGRGYWGLGEEAASKGSHRRSNGGG